MRASATVARAPDQNNIVLDRLWQCFTQLANCFVFLVTYAGSGKVELGGDFLHGPTVKAKVKNLLLAPAENLLCYLRYNFALFGQPAIVDIAPIADTIGRRASPPAGSLRAFLDGIDCPEELAPFVA